MRPSDQQRCQGHAGKGAGPSLSPRKNSPTLILPPAIGNSTILLLPTSRFARREQRRGIKNTQVDQEEYIMTGKKNMTSPTHSCSCADSHQTPKNASVARVSRRWIIPLFQKLTILPSDEHPHVAVIRKKRGTRIRGTSGMVRHSLAPSLVGVSCISCRPCSSNASPLPKPSSGHHAPVRVISASASPPVAGPRAKARLPGHFQARLVGLVVLGARLGSSLATVHLAVASQVRHDREVAAAALDLACKG